MQIKVLVAYLVVGETETRLTKDMARQLHICPLEERWNQKKEEAPRAVAKVKGHTIRAVDGEGWYLMVEHPVATYAWVRAVDPGPELEKEILDKGGWVDDLTLVPTILV